ncbi:carboxypeptidase regulatory-like domain-containing protein [Tunturiibacter gelidiferens]|uniref:Carboxypeptidase regulatory-like domain-containing protein n=1 Tax=Tunturiibacter gelidiferens TaxID=3069689 RepID=A0AAU7YZG4_9BACT
MFLFLFANFSSLLCANAAPLHVVVVDQTGAGFPDVLVIVKPLEGGGEVFRALSDKNGTIPARDLPSGPYQLIATCPYGLCQTTVRELMVKSESFDLKLPLAVMPTSGNTVTIGHIKHRDVEVQDRAGKPIPAVAVLVRDATAQHERWYKTGANGLTTIDVPPGVEMTVVAVGHGNLVSSTVKTDDDNDKILLQLQL